MNAPSGWISKTSGIFRGKSNFFRKGKMSIGRKRMASNESKSSGDGSNSKKLKSTSSLRGGKTFSQTATSTRGGNVASTFGPTRLLGMPKTRPGIGGGKYSFM